MRPSEYPLEVATTLGDLMRFEWLVRSKRLIPERQVYSILAGRHGSRLRGRGLDFEETRPYVPGDDIRNIDWRVTARTGKVHSKVFNEERERPSFIIVDQSSQLFFGSQRYMKSVSAAHAAALGAFYTLKRGDRVGGIIFGDDGFDHVSPRRNRELLEFFLQCIVKWNQRLPGREHVRQNTSLLNKVVKEAAGLINHDHVVTIISDFSAMAIETKELLKKMSEHNDVILVHLYDAFEERLPDGKLVLTDGKDQLLWNNNKKNMGKAYSEDFREMQRRLTEEFRETRIPVVYFNTTEPIEDQIVRDLAQYKLR